LPLLFAKLNNSQLWKKTNLFKNSPLQGGYILPAANILIASFIAREIVRIILIRDFSPWPAPH
jgi:hypothetical protein